jgi:hypothetical protein
MADNSQNQTHTSTSAALLLVSYRYGGAGNDTAPIIDPYNLNADIPSSTDPKQYRVLNNDLSGSTFSSLVDERVQKKVHDYVYGGGNDVLDRISQKEQARFAPQVGRKQPTKEEIEKEKSTEKETETALGSIEAINARYDKNLNDIPNDPAKVEDVPNTVEPKEAKTSTDEFFKELTKGTETTQGLQATDEATKYDNKTLSSAEELLAGISHPEPTPATLDGQSPGATSPSTDGRSSGLISGTTSSPAPGGRSNVSFHGSKKFSTTKLKEKLASAAIANGAALYTGKKGRGGEGGAAGGDDAGGGGGFQMGVPGMGGGSGGSRRGGSGPMDRGYSGDDGAGGGGLPPEDTMPPEGMDDEGGEDDGQDPTQQLGDKQRKNISSQTANRLSSSITKNGGLSKLRAGLSKHLGGAVTKVFGKGCGAIVVNPYFWLFVFALFLIIVVIMVIMSFFDSTNQSILAQRAYGKSDAFLKYYGVAGGESNNILLSPFPDKPAAESDSVQKIKLIRLQYGFKLRSALEYNALFDGSDKTTVRVNDLILSTSLCLPQGYEYELNGGIRSFNSLFSPDLPRNMGFDKSQTCTRVQWQPKICDGLKCEDGGEENFILQITFKEGVPRDKFSNGTGIFQASFGGDISLTRVTMQGPVEVPEPLTIPIIPPREICLNMHSGGTEVSCDSPTAVNNQPTGSNGGGGIGTYPPGTLPAGYTCPLEKKANTVFYCTNGFNPNGNPPPKHEAIDIQPLDARAGRTNGGNYKLFLPISGKVRFLQGVNHDACGYGIEVVSTSGDKMFRMYHVAPTSDMKSKYGAKPFDLPAGYEIGTYADGLQESNCWTGYHLHYEEFTAGSTPDAAAQERRMIDPLIGVEKVCNIKFERTLRCR